MTILQSPQCAQFDSLLPSPFSLYLPQISGSPPPPYLWKSFFDHFISCNLLIINILHFYHVDESVTANLVFCPLFGQKEDIMVPKTLIFAFSENPQVPQFGIFAAG
jgi:hypothetical protein